MSVKTHHVKQLNFKGMKKITFFIALAVATMATAQTLVQNEKALEVRKATFSAVEVEGDMTVIPFSAEACAQKAVAEGEYAAADYYFVDGMLHSGMSPEGYSLTMPLIMLPFQDSTVWNSYYGPTSWYSAATDELLAENSETYTMYAFEDYLFGAYYLPYTTDHNFTLNGVDYLIKGYTYAEASGKGGAAFAIGETPIAIDNNGTMLYFPMTLCGMETSTLYEENGSDFYQVGTKNTRGLYKHGTGLYLDTMKTQRIDTMGQVVRNVSPMKIEQIFIPIYNQSSKDITGMLPEGASVKVEIFNADITASKIDLSEPIATAEVTAADFVDMNGTYGTLVVKFWEEDILGGTYETPIWVEGDFYLQLTNYNETGCVFGIFSDYHTPAASTYYTKDGEIFRMNINGDHNMAIGYLGYWPNLTPDALTDEVTAPVEGGIAYYGEDVEDNYVILLTNVTDGDAYSFDAPEWVSFEPQLVNLSESGTLPGLVFQVTAEPLTEGTGRQGVITVDADGFVYELTVKQGDGGPATGVENVITPSFNGKTYNLLGVEVDENYKGIVIKNGEKFIQ